MEEYKRPSKASKGEELRRKETTMKSLFKIMVVVVIFALAFIPAASYSKTTVGQSPDEKITTSKASETGDNMKFQASEIIGKGVQNDQGEYLGVIRDLMIDPQNGGISFALLSPGGVLGIPMRFVPVPFGAMAFNPAKNVYLLDVSREKIIAAPGFDRGEFPQQAGRGWETEVFRYYGQTPAWGSDSAAGRAAYRFSEIRGMPVRDGQGERLGSIRDLVIDSKGHVPEAVISHGGFLGIAAKSAAVSLSDLKFDAESRSFVLGWTKEQLDRAPAFQESKIGTRS
jgi:sporulation protein YlmC with PRC-barrel domain